MEDCLKDRMKRTKNKNKNKNRAVKTTKPSTGTGLVLGAGNRMLQIPLVGTRGPFYASCSRCLFLSFLHLVRLRPLYHPLLSSRALSTRWPSRDRPLDVATWLRCSVAQSLQLAPPVVRSLGRAPHRTHALGPWFEQRLCEDLSSFHSSQADLQRDGARPETQNYQRLPHKPAVHCLTFVPQLHEALYSSTRLPRHHWYIPALAVLSILVLPTRCAAIGSWRSALPCMLRNFSTLATTSPSMTYLLPPPPCV